MNYLRQRRCRGYPRVKKEGSVTQHCGDPTTQRFKRIEQVETQAQEIALDRSLSGTSEQAERS